MLDAVSTGLHPSAVVGQLAGKYRVSERRLWSDWQRRAKWVPVLLGLEKFAGFGEMVVERLNAVQKAAWSIYLKASNDNARVGALRTVLDAFSLVMQAFVRSVVCLFSLGGFAGEHLEYSYHHQEETCNSEGVYDDVVEDDRT